MGRMKDLLIDEQTPEWERVEFTFDGAPTAEHRDAWKPWFVAHGIDPNRVAAKGWIEARGRQIIYAGWDAWPPRQGEQPHPIVVDLDRDPDPFPAVTRPPHFDSYDPDTHDVPGTVVACGPHVLVCAGPGEWLAATAPGGTPVEGTGWEVLRTGSSSRRWAGGSTRKWRETRAYVLERDQGRCQLRLDGCTTLATCAHHTRPRELVGDNPAYVVGSCESCNNRVADPAAADPQPRPAKWW